MWVWGQSHETRIANWYGGALQRWQAGKANQGHFDATPRFPQGQLGGDGPAPVNQSAGRPKGIRRVSEGYPEGSVRAQWVPTAVRAGLWAGMAEAGCGGLQVVGKGRTQNAEGPLVPVRYARQDCPLDAPLDFPPSVPARSGLKSLRYGCSVPLDIGFEPAARRRATALGGEPGGSGVRRGGQGSSESTFYNRAEAQLADFCLKNPTSPRLPEAVLLQAQARLELTNYAGAIELLAANQGKAGTNADQYLFWLGEAYSRKGDWRAASDTFAKLVKEQPASARCLEASVGEASARSALAQTEPAEWQRVIALLQETNGFFQTAAATNAASDLAPRGYLLLSEAQLAAKDYRAAEATLQPLTNRVMNPRLGWQWQYLLCRIQLADGRTNAALQGTTNLLAIAAGGAQTNLLAESAAFRAGLLERLGQTNEALVAYQRNLAEGIPAERQRQALLKITELSLAQDTSFIFLKYFY